MVDSHCVMCLLLQSASAMIAATTLCMRHKTTSLNPSVFLCLESVLVGVSVTLCGFGMPQFVVLWQGVLACVSVTVRGCNMHQFVVFTCVCVAGT